MSKNRCIYKTVKRTWGDSGGWGNGYVFLPADHPLIGISYVDINLDKYDIAVHGGITFAEHTIDTNFDVSCDEYPYVYGFDTNHYADNKTNWNEREVIRETIYLKTQLDKILIDHRVAVGKKDYLNNLMEKENEKI